MEGRGREGRWKISDREKGKNGSRRGRVMMGMGEEGRTGVKGKGREEERKGRRRRRKEGEERRKVRKRRWERKGREGESDRKKGERRKEE